MSQLSANEIVEELQSAMSAQENPEGFFTTDEYSIMLGVGPAAVRRRLLLLQREGRIEQSHKTITNLAGRPQKVTAYRILTE